MGLLVIAAGAGCRRWLLRPLLVADPAAELLLLLLPLQEPHLWVAFLQPVGRHIHRLALHHQQLAEGARQVEAAEHIATPVCHHNHQHLPHQAVHHLVPAPGCVAGVQRVCE
jgi:hypothetical protein